MDQCRRLALCVADYEALSPHGRSDSWPGAEGFTRIAGEVAGPVVASYGPPMGRFPKPWFAQVVPAPRLGPTGF
eukprot:5876753-Alexandrium_andersonii.AAC.1